MTNKEIRLELAKIALERCTFSTSETLTESLKNLYEWIVEEEENDNTKDNSTEYDNIDIRRLINTIERDHTCIGAGVRLANLFYAKNINTIGDLLRIDKWDFSRYEGVGKKTLWAIDEALEELGIRSWN